MQFVEVTEEAYDLAHKYLDEKVVDKTSADDFTARLPSPKTYHH